MLCFPAPAPAVLSVAGKPAALHSTQKHANFTTSIRIKLKQCCFVVCDFLMENFSEKSRTSLHDTRRRICAETWNYYHKKILNFDGLGI